MIAICVAAHAVSSYSIGAERRMESNKATHSVNDNSHSVDSKSNEDNEPTVYVIAIEGKDEKAEKDRDTEEIGKKYESFLLVNKRKWLHIINNSIAHFLLLSTNMLSFSDIFQCNSLIRSFFMLVCFSYLHEYQAFIKVSKRYKQKYSLSNL